MKTKKKATPADQRPTCSVCGGHAVETNAWIEYRPDGTAAIVSGEGPIGDEFGNWCHDCQEHHELNYPATTPADDARRQAADAAREAGPELVAVLRRCRTRLQWFRDNGTGDGWTEDDDAAIEAAEEMLSRCAPAIRRKN
jgi:hypothetical protein